VHWWGLVARDWGREAEGKSSAVSSPPRRPAAHG
jgi:hypothetical protein